MRFKPTYRGYADGGNLETKLQSEIAELQAGIETGLLPEDVVSDMKEAILDKEEKIKQLTAPIIEPIDIIEPNIEQPIIEVPLPQAGAQVEIPVDEPTAIIPAAEIGIEPTTARTPKQEFDDTGEMVKGLKIKAKVTHAKEAKADIEEMIKGLELKLKSLKKKLKYAFKRCVCV